jgi:1,4-alpha-glucan branching enzyme
MSLVKKNLKTGNVCKVTFTFPAEAARGVKIVRVAGDFNQWDTKDPAYKMTKKKDGSFSITLPLEKGREYQFRYFLDEARWENDWTADKYVAAPNTREENSVVIV